MEKITLEQGKIDGLLIFSPKVFADQRGCFLESYNRDNFEQLGFNEEFLQDNISYSNKNVIRGLHYQWDGGMGKLIQAVKGSLMDVAVDIRHGSPTFGQYESVILSESNNKLFWVPPGFAHGFIALEHDTVAHYKCTAVYNDKAESGINPLDRDLDIDWGVNLNHTIISEKDVAAQSIEEYVEFPKFNYK
ncbi:MAG: dTDP-4-dehydrorhamnose 3,5-epimerase [Bacteroidetes bacterium]|nr:dTDP-4-dehydrorhamnose 3,5-epimerase [Bacteroidota bacterium]